MKEFDNIIRNIFEAMWLRPEAAIWRAREIQLIRESQFDFFGRSIDIGGGDGTFTFLLNGGRFLNSFDTYSISNTSGNRLSGIDIHSSSEGVHALSHKDIIDHPSTKSIEYNFDINEKLLEKSKLLKLYNNQLQGSLETEIPVNGIDSAFCSILHYFRNPNIILRNIYSKFNRNGKLLIIVPNSRFKKHTNLYKYKDYSFDKEFLKILDTGRSIIPQTIYDKQGWIEVINSTDWLIVDHQSYLSDDLVSFWDLGLRPISTPLIKVFNSQAKSERLKYKKEFVDSLMPVVSGFIHAQPELEKKLGSNFEMFILKK